MLRIYGRSIPHVEHRYPTCGDYWQDENGVDHVRVSEMSDWRYEFLVFFHECIEAALCRQRGISEHDITAFDKMFEEERERGLHADEPEPGFDIRAPYRVEHTSATGLEMALAAMLQVDWRKYEAEVSELP